jgi:hypothetical protein
VHWGRANLVGVAGNCAAQGWELVFFSFNFAPSGPWKELHLPKLVKRHDMVRGLILAGNTSPNLLELRDDTDRVHQARFLPIHWWFPGAHLRPGSAGSKYRPLIGRKGTADRSNFNCSGSSLTVGLLRSRKFWRHNIHAGRFAVRTEGRNGIL